MLDAAATALALAEAGEVTARGTLGPLLTREPHRDVHKGDRQAWEWKQAAAEIDAITGQARTDPEAARGVLVMFTAWSCRTAADFNRERQYLVGLGIPEELLPEHRAAGLHGSSPLNTRCSRITEVIRQHRLPWWDATCANAAAPARSGSRLSGNYGHAGRNGPSATCCQATRSPAISRISSLTWRTRTSRATPIRAYRGDLIASPPITTARSPG